MSLPDFTGDIRIVDVAAHALTHKLERPSITSWGQYHEISTVIVEVSTDAGISGVGECLARFAPEAYCEAIREIYKPMLVGKSVFPIGGYSAQMRRGLSGRSGGISTEAISGIDIALWDIVGKAANLPVWALLGGEGRDRVCAYGSAVDWGDEALAKERIADLLSRGFEAIKLKIGLPVDRALNRVELARKMVGDNIEIYADANWAYSTSEAIEVGRGLEAAGFGWFEEPIPPEDEDGYRLLHRKLSIPLAAGESDFNYHQSKALISDRTLDVVQPNASRAGGITGARKIATLASMFGVRYAPHIGFSGIICEAATLHLAASADNLFRFEVTTGANPFRDRLADLKPANMTLSDGKVPVPTAPGLGLSLNWDEVNRLKIRP